MHKGKTLAIYEANNNPTRKDVTHVAIRIDITPAYVDGVYRRGDRLPLSSDNILVMPKDGVGQIFYFRKGSLEELRRPRKASD